jgi:endonuclease YncB( thermonuclease family)
MQSASAAWSGGICAIAFLALLATASAASDGADPQTACPFGAIASATVSAVADARTLVLDDGREVLLTAIEVPPSSGPGAEVARNSQNALGKLLIGRPVELRRLDSAADRYGRLPAHVFVDQDGVKTWVQAALLEAGYARVSGRIGDGKCATVLRGYEAAAHKAQLGLWADPKYLLKSADDPAGVAAERGRFALVDGKVVSVRDRGATIYVNFGRRWSEDFTVTIARRNLRRFVAAGVDPKRLAGRRVRVRGWIEERGGPWIEAIWPEQIELIAPQ